MLNLPELKRRITSVKQTRQITGAMETISVSKMRKSIEACDSAKAYIDGLSDILSSVLVSQDDALKEYIAPPENGLDAVIVISSDRGLCGAFNHDLIKAAQVSVNDNSFVIPIGQTADKHFTQSDNIDTSFVELSSSCDMTEISRLTDMLLSIYGSKIKSVSLVYGKLVTKAVTTVVTKRLLPLEISDNGEALKKIEFDPSPMAVLDGLLPLYIGGMIYGALLDSAAAEHSARRAAMSASTKNADAMIEALSLEYSRARQSTVTSQITEIIGSRQAQAQTKKGDRR